jgi:hypothetical protein
MHGLLSSIVAILALYEYIPENAASMATISYFIVDFINIMLNDFVFHAKSYQTPGARKVEYCHHILCCVVGVMSEFSYKRFCTFERNPFIQLMFAEFSTPFLMTWRYTQNKLMGFLFVLAFIGCRIIYHGFYFIPLCMKSCHASVGYGFGVPYNVMNAYFLFMILRRMYKEAVGQKSKVA